MDELYIWLEKLLNWVDRCGPPPIPYAGWVRAGYSNIPRSHIEIVCLLEREARDIRLGPRLVNIPAFHLALHSVHQGAYTPTLKTHNCWCVFLDVTGEKDFADLCQSPLFACAPLRRKEVVVAAFEEMSRRCAHFGKGPFDYDAPEPLYHPVRDGKNNPTAVIHMKAALLEFLAVLLDDARMDGSSPGQVERPAAVQKAIEHMSLHQRQPGLSLPGIAAVAGLSVDHFGRLFRETMKETPMQYLRRLRIKESRFLLEHTSLEVKEVALSVGFNDPFLFSRVFRAVTGIPPSRWRTRKHAAPAAGASPSLSK